MQELPTLTHCMTPFPYSIDIERPVSAARALMREHGVRHLPVTDDGALAGVVSDRDLGLAVGP